ncbi:MAG: hypothetical protein QXR59_03425 [Candidatus Bathyarchaeia archaeon]
MSGWDGSTPLSSTAITASELPVEMSHAPGAPMVGRCHCLE